MREEQDFDLTEEDLIRTGKDEFDHFDMEGIEILEAGREQVEKQHKKQAEDQGKIQDGKQNAKQDMASQKMEELAETQTSPRIVVRILLHIGSIVGSVGICAICLAGLCGMLFYVHPDISPQKIAAKHQQYEMSAQYDAYVANKRTAALNEYLSGEHMLRKIYRIPDGTVRAPEANPACFGSIEYGDAEQVLDVIEQARASGLLEGQECVFDPDAEFFRRGNIKYYLDDTLLVICWKEHVGDKIVNLMEVKMADASQFRRKLSGDAYGAGMQMFATQLAAQTNAVAACSADYYAFRSLGMVCYEGTVYRYSEKAYEKSRENATMGNCLDTLFVNRAGDFVFLDRGTDLTKEELQSYLDENEISFSLCFGPILVRDGVAQKNKYYPVGESNQFYSRAGIGQLDHLHYLYMLVSHYGEAHPGATTNEFADMMADRGVQQGYNLDGGQTGEYVFHNELESIVDFGDERVVSDILYFATALPKEEWE